MNDSTNIRDKKDLLHLTAFDTPLYDRYALTSLAAYSLFWLQEWSITTSLENLAVANFKMFPVKFSLVGWPQFPDINRTNRTVLQMRPKYRNLATSTSAKGVFLNNNGTLEAMSILKKIGPPLFAGRAISTIPIPKYVAERGKGQKPRSIHPQDIMDKIRKSQLFELYKTSQFDKAKAIHLIGMLDVYDHTPSAEKRRKLKELKDAAIEFGDSEAQEFLKLVSEIFHRYLNK